jgi:hypothetical protein
VSLLKLALLQPTTLDHRVCLQLGILQCDHAEEACKAVQGCTELRIERLDAQHTSDAVSSPEPRRMHSASGVVRNHTCNTVHHARG